MTSRDTKLWIRWLGVAVMVTFFTALYWRGAVRQMSEVNLDVEATDQSAYIAYARQLLESNYTYIGDHNRMPLYPAIQSLFLEAEMKRREIFQRGKWVNLYLSLPLLGGIALLVGRRFTSLHTLNLMLITGFMVFVFKAGWYQAELLFYFLSFCLFLEMVALLRKPSYSLAALIGVTAGLSHLTKASILPGLAIFTLAYAMGLARDWLQRRHAPEVARSEQRRRLLSLPLALLVFLATIYPYIATSKRVFGQYFYNVNSTFYIWYDSWEEAKQGTRAFGDRVGWPEMPPEQIPSLAKYLREHTLGQIAGRFTTGAQMVWNAIANSYGYLPYVLLYAWLLAVAALVYRQAAIDLIRANPILVTFTGMYFSAYLLLYFWYAPIAVGNRLVLALFLPLITSLSGGLQALLAGKSLRVAGRELPLIDAINLAILPFLLFGIGDVLANRVGSMYGGD